MTRANKAELTVKRWLEANGLVVYPAPILVLEEGPPRTTYRADWMVDGDPDRARLALVEVKARWRNGRVGWQGDGRTKWRIARAKCPCFQWALAIVERDGSVTWTEDEA